MAGVMTTRDALARAYSVGLDLLEISPTAEPPVVKILDYGKFKYEQQKKKNEARKKQKVIEIKEVQGDKVKVSLRFKGREMAHQELGIKMLERIRIEMEEKAKVEQMPKLENRQMIMVLAPR
ncbi:translation initiation factor IF-3-like [Sabethes cyaneus]|uniref:translation initiation factor IF-3-like n=1 Tax=Sabethes cyaneus TaxID=53552 RepID=UPI00237D6A3F|nr:translation initiation factor IF-3-like [Sabethes cyaneus]